MDTSIFFFINKGLHNIIFDAVMPFITQNGCLFFAVFVLCSLFLDRRKALLVFSLSIITLIVSDASGHILKDLFERPRPCQILENVRLLVGCGGSYSLPSNHTVNAFALATVFSFFSVAFLFWFSLLPASLPFPEYMSVFTTHPTLLPVLSWGHNSRGCSCFVYVVFGKIQEGI